MAGGAGGWADGGAPLGEGRGGKGGGILLTGLDSMELPSHEMRQEDPFGGLRGCGGVFGLLVERARERERGESARRDF